MPESSGYGGARVALVHDFLLDLRGAERVFAAMCDLWPDADVFSAVYDEEGTEGRFAHRNVNTSFLQRLRPSSRTFRALLPLYPYAMEQLDLSAYDLVISSSSAWAHGVVVDEHTTHVCYCYNPFRYAWNARETTLARRDPVTRAALGAVLSHWRRWDWIAAQRVDRYVAISQTTRRRIGRYFGREASVVFPPVDIGRFSLGYVGEHYLMVSELMPHKRIDVAVRAFNELRLPLVVVGDGPEVRRLRRLAGPTVTFAGRVSDRRAEGLLRSCRALVVTAVEEFGIAAVEAQASGRPVLALADGGARETVIEGETGAFYPEPTPQALAELVTRTDPLAFDPAACTANAARFTVEAFERALRGVVREAMSGEGEGMGARAHRRPLRRAARATLRQ